MIQLFFTLLLPSMSYAILKVLLHMVCSIQKALYNLVDFFDFDWAGSPGDRKSTTGYGIYLGPCLISWMVKKQAVVAKSSTEAKYRSMALAVAEMYWIHMLFKELSIPLVHTPCLWVDNIGALALSSNPVYHAHTKHIEVDYHFIREKIFSKDLLARYIFTHDQPSDIFTKGMSKPWFLLLRNKLMVISLPINLQEDVRSMKDMISTSAATDSVGIQNIKDKSNSR
jgi:hypothetical protein